MGDASLAAPAKFRIHTVVCSLEASPFGWLVHQTNCTHSGEAQGVAATIFETHPDAECYTVRQRTQTPSEPGTIEIAGRIVNLMGQFGTGAPQKQGCRKQVDEWAYKVFPEVEDTKENRASWFRSGLAALGKHMGDQSVSGLAEGYVSLPPSIGCGLANGEVEPLLV